ncbi:MAG: pilus assembly protein [Syntrophomonadaceae bacterium]|nr:pilus assembly protein [Syntrophomonadaceae bacterium]
MASFNRGQRTLDRNHGGDFNSQCQKFSQYDRQQGYGLNGLRFLRRKKGSAAVDFLIISTLIFFILFVGTDYFLIFAQHQVAKHVMHYHLERVRVEGWLSAAEENAIIDKYNAVGMQVAKIICTNQNNSVREKEGGERVYKNPDNPDNSQIELRITLKPNQRPFLLGSLIGAATADDDFRIKVGGFVLSEKVPS